MFKNFFFHKKKQEARFDIMKILMTTYPHVSDKVFGYLDIKSLESAKQISTLWRKSIEKVINRRLEKNWKIGNFAIKKLTMMNDINDVWKLDSDEHEVFVGVGDSIQVFNRNTSLLTHTQAFNYPNSKNFDFNESIFYITGFFMYSTRMENRPTTESERKIVVYNRSNKKKLYSYKFHNDDFEYSTDKVYLGFEDCIYVSLNGHTKIVACKKGYKNCIITFPTIPIMKMKVILQHRDNEKILCLRTPIHDLRQNNELSCVHLFRKPLPIQGRKEGLYHSSTQISGTLGVELYKPIILKLENDELTFIDVLPDSKIHLKKFVIKKLDLKDKLMTNLTNLLDYSVTMSIGRSFLIGDKFLMFEFIDERYRDPNQIRMVDLNNKEIWEKGCLDDVSRTFLHVPVVFGSYDTHHLQFFNEMTLLTKRDPIFNDSYFNFYDFSIPDTIKYSHDINKEDNKK